MPSPADFLGTLDAIVARYLAETATARELLPLLRWQITQGDALDQRTTMPGHLTTSAFIVSPDHRQILLIDHITIGRWLQPGGHYEPSDYFYQSAIREAVEETAITGLTLHPWHQKQDRPFVIDSHDVPGKAARHEPPHIHHDLQYLFIADPSAPLAHQAEEVHAARWTPIAALDDISPKAAVRLRAIGLV